ncbi:CYTH domain-containing protein [Pseudooceanicola sp. HF7]|uniref:CYTH domain-containing protein n=1 Tax=Pseudooceanicola sp. HF7 TaxID=2721560 RepID=UPI001432036D|nr:CYTH domain-containing protein [Pseudooceanicola sp. HF7]NIZ09042.1 CYTH domain-containing protein [Pseudooceanicola sp. HF7]
MAREIERKFLIASDSWRAGVSKSVRLRDGLVAQTQGRKVRVRFYDDDATLTIKGPCMGRGFTRDEFEYPIPAEDAQTLLSEHCSDDVVEKTRHHVPFAGFEWCVDEYDGLLAGVLIAEVELPSEEAEPPLPDWAGAEVTGDPAYRKINMLEARRKAQRATA